MTVPEEVLRTPLLDRLFARASDERPVFTFQDFPAGEEHTLSWAQLAARVRAVAGRLREVAAPGDRVAIVAPQELSYPVAFFGVLAAGLIAVPLFDPASRAHRGRLAGALRDCGADVWLTSARALDRVRELGDPAHLLVLDEIDGDGIDPVPVAMDAPAYLQYTSGSTREPAGAIITHRALVASCWQTSRAYEVDEGVTCVGWIPFFHDMGLIQLLCLPVFGGARSVFMAPVEFVRRPERWLRQMSEFPNVFTAAPNFAFDLAVEAASREGLDLSGVRVALNGSEPVRPRTVEEFQKAFGPYGFRREAHRPSYGLAEATVYVASAGPEGPTTTAFDRSALARGRAVEVGPDFEDRQELVSVGRPLGQRVAIVHEGREQPEGAMGEIWVHGPHVAAGYWRREDDAFGARLDGLGGWLRTGDLGVFHRGELYITGRIKDVIVIDGRNHYPQDIEATAAQAHPAIRRDRVAAFGVRDARGEGVVVVAEQARETEVDPKEVSRAVLRAVGREHEVALRSFRLVPPGALPRTSSGKVARSAARTRYGDGHE
ncbi:fatty acyl-AMP ligase [Amycolatopsis acidiphila]|uniref:Fatty acyl-AMP ligase n=1 Tax=Amycolatopsis acidiphila TaxID=715473 RepID=A0A557ZP96_9PSEU|nr:fatty acyl-AMP ligase [Amycolatopsis acidiphila]TVT13820.1 fatty acyl-AMP ligase [Amycolatopsis acidiphila]UIJ60730.1 fatty acyl-AMP ligase [Amycolatopsis acidiphila]GHG91160.1 acyl-CoA synthetase [Amycolatopsis acidiphila]